jgi:hypothetical protein
VLSPGTYVMADLAEYAAITAGLAGETANGQSMDLDTLDLQAVPEPTGLTLLASGGLGLFAALRRRHRS